MPKKFTAVFLFFIFTQLFSAIRSPSPFLASLEIIKWGSIYATVITGISILRHDKKAFSILLLLILTIGSFFSLIGLLEYTSRHLSLKLLDLIEPFHWSTVSAGFFLLIAPIAFVYFLTKGKQEGKILSFIVFVLSSLAWILTRRYLLLYLLIGVSIIYVYFRDQTKIDTQKSIKTALRNLALAILTIIVFLPNFSASYGTNILPQEIAAVTNQSILQDKKDIWLFGQKMLKEHFFFGIGAGTFGEVYRQHQAKPWTWSNFAGSEPLQILVETGIVGFLAYSCLFIYLSSLFLKKIRFSLTSSNLLDFSLALSAFSFLLLNLTDFSFRVYPILLILFFYVSHFLSRKVTSEENVCPRWLPFIAVLLLFLALGFFADSNLLHLGKKFFVQRKYAQAEKTLNFLTIRPVFMLNPKILTWLSAIAVEKSNNRLALNYLGKALEVSPHNQEIEYQMAYLYYKEGEKTRSQEVLEKSLKSNPFASSKFYLTLAKLFDEEKNLPLRLEWLKRASFSYPIEEKNNFSFAVLTTLDYYNDLTPLKEIYLLLYRYTDEQTYLDSLLKFSF